MSNIGLRLLLLLLLRVGAVCSNVHAQGGIQSGGSPVVSQTNPTYASWNVDSSNNRGFFHINFTNPNLRAVAGSLRPSTLRFGGSGNDYLVYSTSLGGSVECTPAQNDDLFGCFNATHWNEFYDMAKSAGADFLFGISFDKVEACIQMDQYVWNTTAASVMIKYFQQHNQTIWGFELGNEVNNDETKCKLSPTQQADAFNKLSALVDSMYAASSRPVLVGPDSGYYNPQPWLTTVLNETTHIHAVTHHVYPSVNKDNFASASKLDGILPEIAWYTNIIKSTAAPGTQIWAGENGPHSGGEDGTCGTDSICGTYQTVFWYADAMALRALHGFVQFQRQDLIGGRYGLAGIPHDNEFLGPTDPLVIFPDFWVAFLWKRVMGSTVLNMTVIEDTGSTVVRSYAHCGLAPSPYSPSFSTKIVTALLINLDSSAANTVHLTGGKTYQAWSLTPGAGGAASSNTNMNNKPMQTSLSNGEVITDIPVDPISGNVSDGIVLPPQSVSFVAVSGWSIPGCD